MKRMLAATVVVVVIALLGVLVASAQSEGQIGGIVYEDANGNGVREEGERGLQDIEVQFTNEGFSTVINTTSTGAFSLAVNPATWDVEVINIPSGFEIDDEDREVVIENPGDATTNLEFALVPIPEEAADGDTEDSTTLPESGGPISEGLFFALLGGLVIVGGGLVAFGQLRNKGEAAA